MLGGGEEGSTFLWRLVLSCTWWLGSLGLGLPGLRLLVQRTAHVRAGCTRSDSRRRNLGTVRRCLSGTWGSRQRFFSGLLPSSRDSASRRAEARSASRLRAHPVFVQCARAPCRCRLLLCSVPREVPARIELRSLSCGTDETPRCNTALSSRHACNAVLFRQRVQSLVARHGAAATGLCAAVRGRGLVGPRK
jgi:hypothetical protein